MIWIVGLVIYLILLVLMSLPFIVSGRISRSEEASGTYEKSRPFMAGAEAMEREGCDTSVEIADRRKVVERLLPNGKHLPLGGRSAG